MLFRQIAVVSSFSTPTSRAYLTIPSSSLVIVIVATLFSSIVTVMMCLRLSLLADFMNPSHKLLRTRAVQSPVFHHLLDHVGRVRDLLAGRQFRHLNDEPPTAAVVDL